MRRRIWVVVGILLALLGIAVSAGGAYAYFWDASRADVIARGVTIAGVDVGGLGVDDARARLDAVLGTRLRRPVHVVYEGHDFTLHPAHAGVRVDTARMVESALLASREGGLAHRVVRDLRGQRLDVSIPLSAGVSDARVAAFVRRIAHTIDRPAHDAHVTVKPLALGLTVVPSVAGLAVKQPELVRRLTRALVSVDRPERIAVPTHAVAPHVWTSTLKHRYGTYILVSRETFTLRLYKQLRLVKTYPIAVGMAGLDTPAGEYTIDDKQVDPWWHVPNSPWAGALAGKVIPPGPDDPIKARWMGFYDGAGIHGTTEDWSIGSAASHGCIRMHIWDVEDLYDRVPLHSPIYVG